MSRKTHPVSQVLRLIDGLDENERTIVRDYLRAPRRPKSSTAPAAGRRSSSLKKLAGGSGQTSETGKGDAQVAAAGLGGD